MTNLNIMKCLSELDETLGDLYTKRRVSPSKVIDEKINSIMSAMDFLKRFAFQTKKVIPS